ARQRPLPQLEVLDVEEEVRHLRGGGGKVVVPEERHLLFKGSAGRDHAGEPPALQVREAEFADVRRVGKIEAAPQLIFHGAVINLSVSDQVIDGTFAPAGGQRVNLFGRAAEPHAAHQVRRL